MTSPSTDIRATFGEVSTPTAEALDALLNTEFPCGQVTNDALTICASDTPFTPGSVITVGSDMQKLIPVTDPNVRMLSVAFDSDGDPANNRVAAADSPNDPYQGTDVWYELVSDPTNGSWSLVVTDARLPDFTRGNATATSAARAVLLGDTFFFLIPAGESEAAAPAYRTTSLITVGTFTQPDTGIDVSTGGPDQEWTLLPMDDSR